MDLLGGYGSDDDESGEDEEAQVATCSAAPDVPPQSSKRPTATHLDGGGEGVSAKKKKVDISRLPISRPLAVETSASADTNEAPLKRLAQLEALRPSAGKSLLESLPAPKATLGSAGEDANGRSGGGGLRIDLSGLSKPRNKPREVSEGAAGIKSEKSLLLPDFTPEHEVPENVASHPMFNTMDGPNVATPDGPSAEDLDRMRSTKSFTKIAAAELQDPDWYMQNTISGGPGLHKGKKVALEVSNYDSDKWQSTTHANPSRVQKRKHQINWLAQEAMEKEAELLDRNATSRLTKSQTQMKYGW